jgi:starch synthase
VIASSGKPLIGISNGIDYAYSNPATDAALVSRYDAEDPSNKGRCKAALLRELELPLELDRPLVAGIGPLTAQKGFDVVAGALEAILKNNLVLVLAGRGSEPILARLEAGRAGFESSFALVQAPDDAFVHRLFGAADLILIPSRYEPCGSAQLYAQRYGSPPIVHATGGLKDTVIDCDAALETGTGFVFDELTARGLLGALGRALAACHSMQWGRLRRRVMRLDLGWDRPARRYLQVYRQTLAQTH